jgi:hypothetical protein
MSDTDTITKPRLELKKIKYFDPGSQETSCYTAVLYVDGKKFADVSNSGQGGADNVYPVAGGHEAVRDLEKRIKATFPRIKSEYHADGLEPSLEIICNVLLVGHLVRKDFRKAMRRVTYVKGDGREVYQLSAKYKPTPEIIASIKATAPWAKDARFLADMPEDEAFKVFCAGAQEQHT